MESKKTSGLPFFPLSLFSFSVENKDHCCCSIIPQYFMNADTVYFSPFPQPLTVYPISLSLNLI